MSLTILVLTIIVGVILSMSQKKQNATTISEFKIEPIPERNVYVGAWVGGFYDNDKKELDTTVLKKFEQDIGKKVAFANIYSEWAYLANESLLVTLRSISSNGWTPIISSNPYFFEGCEKQDDESLYKTIASGSCDEFLREVAQNLRSYKKPIFLRFAWEMNLPDMYWSVDKTHSTPADFRAAWRHFHDIMEEESADNVLWVLSFNTSSAKTTPYRDLYPGDSYVDWVAIDGYNWGNTHDWSAWTDFNGVFRNSYNELIALTDKPVMLSEVNSAPTGTGGDKARWLHDMLAVQIPAKFPGVSAFVFFNEEKSAGEKVDWRMEISDAYTSVLKKDLQLSFYKSVYP